MSNDKDVVLALLSILLILMAISYITVGIGPINPWSQKPTTIETIPRDRIRLVVQ